MEAGMKTAKLTDEKEVLDRQRNADFEAQKNLEVNVQQLENRKQELELHEKQIQIRLNKILDAFGKHKEDLVRMHKEQREMKYKLEESRYMYGLLKAGISAVDYLLRELKSDRHENERDDKKIEGLKKKKEDLEFELEKLGSIREMQLKEFEAYRKICGLEKKLQYTEIEKKGIEDKLNKLKVEMRNIEDEIGRAKPELQKVLFGP